MHLMELPHMLISSHSTFAQGKVALAEEASHGRATPSPAAQRAAAPTAFATSKIDPSSPAGKAKRLRSAIELFDRMRSEGVAPNLASCNALITACERCQERGRNPHPGFP